MIISNCFLDVFYFEWEGGDTCLQITLVPKVYNHVIMFVGSKLRVIH